MCFPLKILKNQFEYQRKQPIGITFTLFSVVYAYLPPVITAKNFGSLKFFSFNKFFNFNKFLAPFSISSLPNLNSINA